MARIAWNVAGTRFYEAGVDRGVLYVESLAGVPWTGLISVEESRRGGSAKPYYIDGVKYLNISEPEEFEATINAYTYPVEFSQCDGTARARPGLFFGQQRRKSFGLSYRTMIGNDTTGNDHAYKINIVYNALAAPTNRSANSYNDSVEVTEFSWSITTKPLAIPGFGHTAHVVVDSRYTHPIRMAAIEDILYGTDQYVARLPTPEELMLIFDEPISFSVTDNGNDTYLISGPDEIVTNIGSDQFMIDHESIELIGDGSFVIAY